MEHCLKDTRILPVITVHTEEEGVRTVEALAEGGLRVVELTLRTPKSLGSLKKASGAFPHMTLAAGTILSVDQLRQAIDHGATFGISPGLDTTLIEHAKKMNFPYMPGVQTATDIQTALRFGVTCLKFYPAEIGGGPEALTLFAGPFKDVRFCPTGGIKEDRAAAYLSLKNVVTVGGSWIAPEGLIKNQDWKAITKNAKRALQLNHLSS